MNVNVDHLIFLNCIDLRFSYDTKCTGCAEASPFDWNWNDKMFNLYDMVYMHNIIDIAIFIAQVSKIMPQGYKTWLQSQTQNKAQWLAGFALFWVWEWTQVL